MFTMEKVIGLHVYFAYIAFCKVKYSGTPVLAKVCNNNLYIINYHKYYYYILNSKINMSDYIIRTLHTMI